MCGKFTAMASWRELHDQLSGFAKATEEGDDRKVTYRVMSALPVIVWDQATGQRKVLPMRWGFPHPQDWRRPQPIHARGETIDTTKAFAQAFRDGQRGIVLMETFNEAPDVEGPTVQHTITPGDGVPLAAAFLWRSFDIGAAAPLLSCVLVTVPANQLIATLPTDRMPAFLDPGEWSTWLGEGGSTPDQAKACLKTVEGVQWTMSREEASGQSSSAEADCV